MIVDEAHHFRNRGSRGDDTPDGGRGLGGRPGTGDDGQDRRSRYWRLFDMLDGSVRPKLMFLLTATPVNNRLADFRHMPNCSPEATRPSSPAASASTTSRAISM